MWELYTFWAFAPGMIAYNAEQHRYASPNVSLRTFFIIGIGGVSCMVGGYLAQKIGSARVAFYALLCSGICAATSPFFITLPPWVFFGFLLAWGIAVTPDSPQFSTMTALTAPPAIKGTAVTAVICIGFAISIASIQLFNFLGGLFPYQPAIFSMLAIGPLLGLMAFFRMMKRRA
jgi:predicted MFS family arabinose efflux permease